MKYLIGSAVAVATIAYIKGQSIRGNTVNENGWFTTEYDSNDYADEPNMFFRPEAAPYVNDPICYLINDSWWNDRLGEQVRGFIAPMDDACETYNNQTDQCNDRNNRNATDIDGNPRSSEELNAFCTTVGGHSERCLGNPCAHLNTGDCTLQATGGQCVWVWKDKLSEVNAFMRSQGRREYPSHGCNRNPCNMAGLGLQRVDDCEARSIPPLGAQCTWCRGRDDDQLKGRGVGCQMKVLTTTADCAPVSTSLVANVATIEQSVVDSKCQCAREFPACEAIVSGRGGFTPRFPTPTNRPTKSPTTRPTSSPTTTRPTASPTTPFPTASP